MITLQDIDQAVDNGNEYYIALLDADIALLSIGQQSTNHNYIKYIKRLLNSLKWDINISYIGTQTIVLYELLLQEIISQ